MSLFKTIQSIFAPKPPSRYPMDEKPGPSTTDQLNERKAYFDKLLEASKGYGKKAMEGVGKTVSDVVGNKDAIESLGSINRFKYDTTKPAQPTFSTIPNFNSNITLEELLDPRKRMQREGYEEYMKIKRSAL